MLAAGAPDQAAFMADESMQALPGLQPLQYTLGFYLQYMDKVKELVKALQKGRYQSQFCMQTAIYREYYVLKSISSEDNFKVTWEKYVFVNL